jgi:hypothetical protein
MNPLTKNEILAWRVYDRATARQKVTKILDIVFVTGARSSYHHLMVAVGWLARER